MLADEALAFQHGDGLAVGFINTRGLAADDEWTIGTLCEDTTPVMFSRVLQDDTL